MVLSVLMSVYNAAPTLGCAIDSILSQTFSNFEFIICDDASTDESWEIIQAYRLRDSRILAIRNEQNNGLAFSLNRCLKLAQGKYIARQDADDTSEPERLERTLNYLMEKDCPYAGCGVSVFDDKGVWSRRLYPEIITKHIIAQKNPFFHPTMIFKRETLEAVNGYRVAEITRRTEDYDLVMRMAGKGLIGNNLQEYLYNVYEPTKEYKKHTLRTRRREIQERIYGLKQMQAPTSDYIYLFRPLIMCLIPRPFIRLAKKMQWTIIARNRKNEGRSE